MKFKTVEGKYFIDNCDSQILDIGRIILNNELQVRNRLDKTLIKNYSRAMSNGALFPPIVVAKVNDELFLIDGFHRFHAALDLEIKSIPALVEEMTFKEAKVHASLANLLNAKPLTKSEKKNAFMLFIKGGGHKNQQGRIFSYRELSVKLSGLASPATIHRWMWKHFPSVAEQMGNEKILGDTDAETQWLKTVDTQHKSNALNALRSLSDSFKSIENLVYRYSIYVDLLALEKELAKLPMEEPEF